MKKFQNLGRSLTKEQQKKITGGNVVCISCIGGDTLCAGSSTWTSTDTGYGGILCANLGTMEMKSYSCNEEVQVPN